MPYFRANDILVFATPGPIAKARKLHILLTTDYISDLLTYRADKLQLAPRSPTNQRQPDTRTGSQHDHHTSAVHHADEPHRKPFLFWLINPSKKFR